MVLAAGQVYDAPSAAAAVVQATEARGVGAYAALLLHPSVAAVR